MDKRRGRELRPLVKLVYRKCAFKCLLYINNALFGKKLRSTPQWFTVAQDLISILDKPNVGVKLTERYFRNKNACNSCHLRH